jgi:hypothetical protein
MADLYNDTAAGTSLKIDANRKAVADVAAIDFYGNKPLTFFVVDFAADASGETNENEAIKAAVDTISKYATIVIRGNLFDTNTQMVFAVEQSNDSLDYDGNGAETLVEQIEDELIALEDETANEEVNVLITLPDTVIAPFIKTDPVNIWLLFALLPNVFEPEL